MNVKRTLSNGKEESIEFSVDALFVIFDKAKKYESLARLNKDGRIHCNFCGKSQGNVEKLVAGPNVYICNECVVLCSEIIEEELAQSAIETNEQPSEAVAEEKVYGNDCRNGQC